MTFPRLYFLGAPRVERAGVPLELNSTKSIVLLAYLAMQRKPIAREHLLELLWTRSNQVAARKNLRNALWSIRKTLGEETIVAGGDQIALSETVWVDTHEFEKIANFKSLTWESNNPSSVSNLETAIESYRAPFLDGLTLDDAPEFEVWLVTERERLAQLYLRLLTTLIEQQRARGEWNKMITTARRALAHDPLQEPMYRALMEAHAQLGERTQALRVYDTLRAALERELGVAPLPETDGLREAISRGVPTTPHARSDAPRTTRATLARIPLIGRQAEIEALTSEWQTVLRGQTRVALISGELGIGKSRLWQEWSRTIGNEAFVLETHCLDSTQTLPFAPLIRLFDRADLAAYLFAPHSPVAPTWLAEAARLLPDIRARLPTLPVPATLPPDEERLRLFEALAQLLLALARPLVIFVDDVHWADRVTLDWLSFLTHRFAERPLLLVVAYRPEDAPAPLSHLIANWARENVLRRLPLARLSPTESAALVSLLGADPALTERAQKQSAGNPYFLIELLRAAPNDVPPALGELVRARLEALPETARQIAQAAAVLESDFDLTLLRRTSGRDEEETLRGIDTLLSANILIERQQRYEFTHPLVAAIVREGLSHARRAFLHRRAGETLESAYTARLQSIAGRLAWHYAQAGEVTRAARFAELAAEQALSLAAPDQAAQFYRQALGLEPTPSRQMGLGRVLLRLGELDAARAAFENALHEFQAANNWRGAAHAAVNIAETYFPAGHYAEGKRSLERALDYMNTDDDPVAHAMAHLMLGSGSANDDASFAEMEQHLHAATRHAQEHQLSEIAARSQFVLGNLRAEHGDLRGAVSAYAQSITFAREAGNDYQEILGHNNLAYHALLLNDLETAHTHIAQAFALAEAHVLRVALQYLHSTRGEIALVENRLKDAEDDFRRGLALAEALGNNEQAAGYHANLALVARARGDLDTALIALEEARARALKLNTVHLQTKIELWLAEVYHQRGERAAFEQTLARVEARLQNSGRHALQEWAQRLRGK